MPEQGRLSLTDEGRCSRRRAAASTFEGLVEEPLLGLAPYLLLHLNIFEAIAVRETSSGLPIYPQARPWAAMKTAVDIHGRNSSHSDFGGL